MRKILLLFTMSILLTGCGAFQKSENIRNWHIKTVKNEGEGVSLATPLGISYDYYRRCKEEYKNKIKDGVLKAENNGITIDIAKYRDKDVVVELYYGAKKENKKELVEEINTALAMSGMRKISMDEFDENSNYAMTIEETKAIDKGKSIGREFKEPLSVGDIEIVKYEGDPSSDGNYFRILISKK